MMYWHIGERINRDVLGNERAELVETTGGVLPVVQKKINPK